jgi:hypothetical protein
LAETVIIPSGENAVQAGTLIDDRGDRFAVLRFQEAGAGPVIVTFTLDTFRTLAGHIARTAEQIDDEDYWRNHKR